MSDSIIPGVLPPGRLDVLYGRFSPRRNAEECESVQNQFDKLRPYAIFRQLKSVVEFADLDFTADIPFSERPAGGRVVQLMREGRIRSISVTRLDRIFRNGVDAYLNALHYRDLDCAIRILDFGGQELDTSSEAGKFFLWMAAGMAQFERATTAERTSEAMHIRAARGERMSSQIEYGWREDPTGPRHPEKGHCLRLLRDTHEQMVIAYIVDLHTSKKKGVRAIARHLREAGYDYRGKGWHPENIKRILVRAGAYDPAPAKSQRRSRKAKLIEAHKDLDRSLAVISQTRKKDERQQRMGRRSKENLG